MPPAGRKTAASSKKATTPTQETTNRETDERLSKVNKQHLELITEIRSLTLQVRTLHTIFVKRTVLWWVLGVETAIVVIALVAVGFLSVSNHNNTNHLVQKFQDACVVRNTQIGGTKHFITDTQQLQAESEQINARLIAQLGLHLSQSDAKKAASIQKRYVQVLRRYQKSQPKPLKCDVAGDG